METNGRETQAVLVSWDIKMWVAMVGIVLSIAGVFYTAKEEGRVTRTLLDGGLMSLKASFDAYAQATQRQSDLILGVQAKLNDNLAAKVEELQTKGADARERLKSIEDRTPLPRSIQRNYNRNDSSPQ